MAFSTVYAIDTKPPSTPLSMTRTGHSLPSDLTQFLPEESTISSLTTPLAVFEAIKDHLALAGSSKALFKTNPKEPSFRDITAATAQATKALDTPIEKTASSLLQAVHELLLRPAQRPAWHDATFLQEMSVHATDASKNTTKTVDILKHFTDVPLSQMTEIATNLWSDADSYPKSADGISHFYVRKMFAALLMGSLSPEFKVLIQSKMTLDLLVDGPLVWLTIAQAVFASGAVLNRNLKNSMIELNVPGSNDNYATYLQKLRASLILSPDEQDPQVYETFLREMEGHPATSVKNTFAEHCANYYANGKLPMPFAELVDKAERLVAIAELTTTQVPRKSPTKAAPNAKPRTGTSNPTSIDDSDDILTLLAERVDSQQETMKRMLGLLSSLENQHKQFKANYAKQSHSGGGSASNTGTNRQPPFASKAPTDPEEVRTWNDKSWYWCAKCKYGVGCWSPSHSTNGNAPLSIDPHRGTASTNKRNSSATDTGAKKQKTYDNSKSRTDLKSMKASIVVAGGRTMAAILAERRLPATEEEQN